MVGRVGTRINNVVNRRLVLRVALFRTLNYNSATVVSVFVEEVHSRISLEVCDGVIPLFIICKYVVKNRRVPLKFTGKEDVGKRVPFFVSVGAHLHASEPVLDLQGD